MRRLVIGVGIMLALVLVAALVFAATFNVNHYRGAIQTQLEKRLGRSVSLGEMHVNLFPPRFRVENPAISDDSDFSADAPFIKAQQLDVAVKLTPLLHKEIEITSLDLLNPSVNLIRNSAGVWNFASLGHPVKSQSIGQAPVGAPNQVRGKAAAQESDSSERPSKQQLSLAELTIHDGQISVVDQQKSKLPSLYDHIDATLKNLGPNSQFTLDASVHMAGSGTQEVRLRGQGGPIVNDQPETTPFRGTLGLKTIRLSDLSKFLNSPILSGTDGIITGDVQIDNQSGKLTLRGQTDLQAGKVHGMELGYPIGARYEIANDMMAKVLTIRKLALKLGSTPVDVSGTVNSRSMPSMLDLSFSANNISVAEAAKLIAASGVALSESTLMTGNLNATIRATGTAEKPALNGKVVATNLQMSGNGIPQSIQIPSIDLALKPTLIQSNQFTLFSGGTSVNAQIAIRDYLSSAPNVAAIVRSANAQLPAILSMAKAYGVRNLDKVNGEGTMKLDVRATGPLKSITAAEITRVLNGTVDMNLNDITYSGANVTRELSAIAGFLNAGAVPEFKTDVTKILKMTGSILVKNGIAQTNNLAAKLDIGNVGAVGMANLVDQTLNLRLTAVLTQQVSQKAGGSNVGGLMQTALANNRGELVIPALVTGTFAQPKFSPDLQQITQMKMQQLLPNFDNPSSVTGALQNLLGGAKNQSQLPQTPGQQQTAPSERNPVQEIIDIFGQKKKKSDQQPPK